MKKSINITLAALIALNALSLNPQAQAAAFQNGSFEINSGATATGWTVSSDIGFSFNQGHTDGTFAAAFNSGQRPANGVLSQSFTTLALEVYTVTFAFGAFGPNGQTSLSRLQVEVHDGTSSGGGNQLIDNNSAVIAGATAILASNTNVIQVQDQISSTAVNGAAPNAEFSLVSFTFTAQSGDSTLVFIDQSTGGVDNQDAMLDGVTVVPEPSAWVSLALGAAGLLGFRRRRNNAPV